MLANYCAPVALLPLLTKNALLEIKDTPLSCVKMTEHGLFQFSRNEVGIAYVDFSKQEISMLWHQRYGHFNYDRLQLLSRRKFVRGLPPLLQQDFVKFARMASR